MKILSITTDLVRVPPSGRLISYGGAELFGDLIEKLNLSAVN